MQEPLTLLVRVRVLPGQPKFPLIGTRVDVPALVAILYAGGETRDGMSPQLYNLWYNDVMEEDYEKVSCFECGSTEHIHHHHVVPKSLGGKRTTPLCEVCHGLVHGRDFMKQRRLSLEGIAKAKAAGLYKGRKPLDPKIITRAKKLIAKGIPKCKVAKRVGIGESTLYRHLALETPTQLLLTI